MKIITLFLKITDDISENMKNGLNFEASRKEVFRKYEKELMEVKSK
ncbi:MAG: hypothetical protein ACRC7N_21395 [Clostridium sp.]